MNNWNKYTMNYILNYEWAHFIEYWTVLNLFEEKDKSSDIEQQPPFGDRKISNIQPQNRGGGSTKPSGTSYNIDKVWSGAPDGRFGK